MHNRKLRPKIASSQTDSTNFVFNFVVLGDVSTQCPYNNHCHNACDETDTWVEQLQWYWQGRENYMDNLGSLPTENFTSTVLSWCEKEEGIVTKNVATSQS